MSVDNIIETTIGKEGRYSNNPNDRGGETMWGITIAVARANGYQGAMSAMPRATAFDIFKREYFIKPGFAKILPVSEAIAEELFDTGVNMGQSTPAPWLQQWLNAFNRQGRDYPDISEDGIIGPGTVGALASLIRVRGKAVAESIMLKGLNADQAVRYKELTRKRGANEDFAVGWLANRVGL